MVGSDDRPGPESDQVIERGKTYEHAEHGSVEVTGIWKGVQKADTAHNTDETGTIIVRYSTEGEEQQFCELTDTLDEFMEAIE